MKPDSTPPPEVRLLDRHNAFCGRLISLRIDRVLLPDGREATREVVMHPGAVAIVAAPSPGSALLVHQYRHPTGAFLWEIPAGKLEEGEVPLDCARRELEEETGYCASEWTALQSVYTTPGFSNERVSLFLASGLTRVQRPTDRDIATCASFTARELQQMLQRGDLVDAKTVLGLLLAGLLDPSEPGGER
ncbi:NUDIX domain-containing protein [Candidatus Bipolaricaulota bacterium]